MKKRLIALGVFAFAALALAAAQVSSSATKSSAGQLVAAQSPAELAKIKHIVVIYEENHSFDNLYGSWEKVNGISNAPSSTLNQVSASGTPFTCLKQVDVNLVSPPLAASCTDTTTGSSFTSAFKNGALFTIDQSIPATATTCPAPGAFYANGAPNGQGQPGGCTRDIVHRYYQEQYQLDGGKMDRYVAGSDAAGLTQGVYDTKALPIYKYLHSAGHPRYAIGDNFFQAAFGGSFLNHQWLVAATTPVFLNAVNDGGANDLHAVVDANGMPNNYPFYVSPLGTAVKDTALTASCRPAAGRPATPANVECGDFAVNTIQPWYQPYSPGTADAKRLPAQTYPTIGDKLTSAKVSWAWYSGGWSNADGDVGASGWTNGAGPTCSDPNAVTTATYPNCPDKLFQFHHQAFNYFASFAPGTAQRKNDLRDETEFLQAAQASTKKCGLRDVSFVKPLGAENEHPGYASEANGSNHLVTLLKTIEGGACAKDTLVVVTYDEFGGQFDHVPPPGQGGTQGPHDVWGPGTRLPALFLSPDLKAPFVVDHTQYDTTSILATIERRFKIDPVATRDAQVKDFSNVFSASAAKK
jgi:phospholipase C